MVLSTNITSSPETHYIKTYNSDLTFDVMACPGDAWIEIIDTSSNNGQQHIILNYTMAIASNNDAVLDCNMYKQFTLSWTLLGFSLTPQGGINIHLGDLLSLDAGRKYIFLKTRGLGRWKITRSPGMYRVEHNEVPYSG